MAEKKNVVNETLNFKLGDQFEADLTALMEAENAEGEDPIIICLMDTDRFMHINTDFGHEVGDKVLIDVGMHYKKYADANNAEVYRIGGDEFGFIFHTDITKEEVFLLMNEMKNSLNVCEPDGKKVTISIGIAEAFEDATRVQELVRKADGALARVKCSGRDKVGLAREEKMVPKTSHYTQAQLQSLTKLSKREGIGEAILLREALDMLLKKYDN
ncbi:MAG: diguanylate cyclase [Lachnospiraceae bacterium]|nr:diguanylate cyclase [Lachnospiraceae bacterium]